MLVTDHLFAILLAIVHPIVGYISFRRLLRRIDAGEPVNRTALYLNTVAGHWTLFVIVMLLWRWAERDWTSLGFGLVLNMNFAVGVALMIAVVIALLMQQRRVAAAGIEEVREIRGTLGRLDIIIPRNGNELGRFYGLSLTAGIVEETLWRGFMIWYLSQFLPLWVAALVSAIGFGLAHAYQGFGNLPKITLIGSLFVLLFLLTGSLWLPMVLHAAVDILQGRLAYDIIRQSDAGTPARPEDGEAVTTSAS